MTEQLDDLFKQIIHSEKRAQEKKALLETVKQDNVDHNGKLKDIKEKNKSLQGQLALKWHQLSESEMRLILLQKRSKFLKHQRDLQDEEFNQLAFKKMELKEELENRADKFNSVVKVYYNEYDLIASLSNQREITAQSKIEKLKKEETGLLAELSTFNSKEEIVNRMKVRLSTLEREIENRKSTLKELGDRINDEIKERDRLQEQKEDICNIPNTNSEFQRLHKELESYYETGKQLDDMCGVLQAELHELKQVKWRNQLQQSRKQQQQNKKRINESNSMKEITSVPSNFKRVTNYHKNSNSQEEIDRGSDFKPASAFLVEDRDFEESDQSRSQSGAKKPNLSKLTQAVVSQKLERSAEQTNWRFQRTGKFQYKKPSK